MARLEKEQAVLAVIDVQERLLPLVERWEEAFRAIRLLVDGFTLFEIPVVFTEQVPEKLGKTVGGLRQPGTRCSQKTIFSAKNVLVRAQPKPCHWVLIGIETHICVLQTARDLVERGDSVIVVNDATSSRSIYDYSTAIAELRDLGCRISSAETLLFELLKGACAPQFKKISQLVQCAFCSSSSS